VEEKKYEENHSCKLNSCLFFTLSKLSRTLKKSADDIFLKTGLSPSHAFILYLVNLKPEAHQKEVGEYLNLTPSTMTRFVEKLQAKHLIERHVEGKNVFLKVTQDGKALQPEIMKAWSEVTQQMEKALTDEEREIYINLTHKLLDNLSH